MSAGPAPQHGRTHLWFQNSETEKQFDVLLDGYFGIHTPRGGMWSVEGTMTGGEPDYDLHYVVLTHQGCRL